MIPWNKALAEFASKFSGSGDYDSRLQCLCCETAENVKMESSRTAYSWDGVGENPNADIPLCTGCAIDHHKYWDEMWAQYYGGLL